MTRINLSFLFTHLSKGAWMKLELFRKSDLNFTFGQGECGKSNFVRPNSNNVILFKISNDWSY